MCNKIFESNLLSFSLDIFCEVAGCLLGDFIKFKYFVDIFQEKVVMQYGINFQRAPISTKRLSLDVCNFWLLLPCRQGRLPKENLLLLKNLPVFLPISKSIKQ